MARHHFSGLYDRLAKILALDPRYPLDAYVFVIKVLRTARAARLRRIRASKPNTVPAPDQIHLSPGEICRVARTLAHRNYGMMALMVMNHWNIRTTEDFGQIVGNLILSGDLEESYEREQDAFVDVYDFRTTLIDSYEFKNLE